MTRSAGWLVAAALLLASAARAQEPSGAASKAARRATTRSATTRPATSGSTTGPATTQAATGPSLPEEFAILKTRNPFAHGKGKQRPGTQGGPESSLVLIGVVDAGSRMVAFVEDRAAKRVVQVGAGEPLARGRVKAVNLDAIEYEGAAGAKKIEVGQNLNGETAPPVAPASKPSGPPGAPGPGAPPVPGPVPPGSKGPVRVRTAPGGAPPPAAETGASPG